MGAQRLNALTESEVGERCGAGERISLDFFDALGDIDVIERGAAGEGIFLDCSQSGRQRNGRQAFAVLEHARSDLGDALGNGDALD